MFVKLITAKIEILYFLKVPIWQLWNLFIKKKYNQNKNLL